MCDFSRASEVIISPRLRVGLQGGYYRNPVIFGGLKSRNCLWVPQLLKTAIYRKISSEKCENLERALAGF
jgi:hypothetical protein